MKKFNESFYTDDFDQETLDFIQENYNVTSSGKFIDSDKYLKYGVVNGFFWTHDHPPYAQMKHLTKNQFKEKIGMTNESQPEKQERIFKLIDKDGYFAKSNANKEFLEDYGIVVDGFYYYKGLVDEDGDLMETISDWCLIEQTEFEHFEEVNSIPLPKDKPKIEEVFSEQTHTFTKSMLKSGEHVVKLADDSYHIVLGNRLVRGTDYIQLKSMSETLECSFDADLDIGAVYKTDKDFVLNELPSGKSLTLIWQRESPEQKEKRLQKENLELKLQQLHKECKLVEDEIMKLGD